MQVVAAMMFAGLVAFPVGASAQDAGEDSLSSWQAESQPTRASSSVEQSPEDLRVRNAGVGLGISAVAFSTGVVLMFAGLTFGGCQGQAASVEKRRQCDRTSYAGVALSAGSVVGMLTSGILLGKRKRERDSLGAAHTATPRRVQWDLARSRLVF